MSRLFWPPCSRCAGSGAFDRKTCNVCDGAGRAAPAGWNAEMAQACTRAEAELQPARAGELCPACKGVGHAVQRLYDNLPARRCVACTGLGRILEPRPAPHGAPFVTTAETAAALDVAAVDVHELVDQKRLTPVARATINNSSVAYVFDAGDVAKYSEPRR